MKERFLNLANKVRVLLGKDLNLVIFIFIATRIFIFMLLLLNTPDLFHGDIRAEIDKRLVTWDAGIYRVIAEKGYENAGSIEFFGFLPGWPYLLRLLHIPLYFLQIGEIGLILNQILSFIFIFVFIKILSYLNFSTKDKLIILLLFLLYPGSLFLNKNYN
jgi:hypothetical protein